MSRAFRLSAVLLAVALLAAPGMALAKAGGGASMGSRGGMTFSAPPSTSVAPGGGQSFGRTLTPQSPSPGYGSAAPGYAPRPMFGGGGFGSGLLGGLIGAGIGGMLFGRGFFGGGLGLGGMFGLLLQIVLVVFVVRWLLRRFMGGGQPMFAGGGMMGGLGGLGAPMGGGVSTGPAPGAVRPGFPPLPIATADYQEFEQTLKNIQAAWSAQDINGLRQLATPEMVSYFAEQLSQLVSRGVRNVVTDVRLDRGDMAEAWRETGRDYATVAMQFSMLDATYDQAGRVVDGSPTERTTTTELWTFLRAPGGRWLLSAIQQAR